MDQQAIQLWSELWSKQQLLYDYLQKLNLSLDPVDRPNYAGDIANAQYEINRIQAILDQLSNGQPIPFPSDAEIAALRQSVGQLQQAVRDSAAVSALVAAATTVISTWPVA